MADQWAVVELMGHVRLAGKLSEEERFGSKMGRLDIPQGEGFVTQYFGGSSVYRVSIVTEEVARAAAKNTAYAPVSPWELPRALPAPVEAKYRDTDDVVYTPDYCEEDEEPEDQT